MTHIKRIDEMIVVDTMALDAAMDKVDMINKNNSIHKNTNETLEDFYNRMKSLYKKACDKISVGMNIKEVNQIMSDENIELAEYGKYSSNEDYCFFTADGNRHSEGITVIYDSDYIVTDIVLCYE